MLPLQYLSDWCLHGASFTETPQEKHPKFSDYLNQIESPLATLSALERFSFFWTPAAKATCLTELTDRFRPRLLPDAQNRAFAKNGSCPEFLDTTLMVPLNFG